MVNTRIDRYRLPISKILVYFLSTSSCVLIPGIIANIYFMIKNKTTINMELLTSILITALLFSLLCYLAIDRIPLNKAIIVEDNKLKTTIIVFGTRKKTPITFSEIVSIQYSDILFDRFCKSQSKRIIICYRKKRVLMMYTLLVSIQDYLHFRGIVSQILTSNTK